LGQRHFPSSDSFKDWLEKEMTVLVLDSSTSKTLPVYLGCEHECFTTTTTGILVTHFASDVITTDFIAQIGKGSLLGSY